MTDIQPQIFEGKKHMRQIREQLRENFAQLPHTTTIHIVMVGSDKVIERFINMKKKFGEYIGVTVVVHRLGIEMNTQQCQEYIRTLPSKTKDAGGCIVQLPLPDHIDQTSVLNSVLPTWDVDVLGEEAYQGFLNQTHGMIPPVARSIEYALEHSPWGLNSSKSYTMVGYGKLVGIPTVDLLRQRNIIPQILDKESPQSQRLKVLSESDIIITGVGHPHLIMSSMIPDMVGLIDAGTSEGEGVLEGDIDPGCYPKARWYTPVPGGIGPITVAMIFVNLYESSKKFISSYNDSCADI